MEMLDLQAQRGAVGADLANALVHVHTAFVGHGPSKARAVVKDDLVVLLLRDSLTRGERSLAAAGDPDAAIETRRRFNRAMRDDLVDAVQKHTGRRVIGFLCDSQHEPDLVVQVFVLV